MFAVGTCIFGTYVHDQKINIINLVTLGIASIYLWFLMAASIKLERRMFGNYQSSQSALYDDCASSGKFEETFWTSNPATYLIKESDVTGRQTIMNPGLNKIFVTQQKAHWLINPCLWLFLLHWLIIHISESKKKEYKKWQLETEDEDLILIWEMK